MPTFDIDENAFQPDGDGLFDLLVTFDNAPPGNRFGDGDSIEFIVNGTTASALGQGMSSLSKPNGGSAPNGLYVAVHAQGLGDDNEDSGWYTGTPDNVVPAPAGLILLATAVPVFALRRLVRRKQAA
jgi:hypothetical protein